MLKHFKIDRSRVAKVVDVEFYQMSLIKAVEAARKENPELFVEDGIFLPSWSKFAADPVKAKGFWSHMLSAIFLGEGNSDDMNADLQFRPQGAKRAAMPKQRVAMMFLSINNDELEIVTDLTRDILKGFRIVPVGGAFGIKNSNAEQYTKEEIEKASRNGEHVLILSGGMAQRSYSIPQITELYLAYDGGEAGATIQKMSRALTAAEEGKVGRIVSLSFDPNRDDKFDQMLVTTAVNYKKTHGEASLKAALKKVLATVDIFRCTDDGRDRFEFDTYLHQLLTNNSLTRIIGRQTALDRCDWDTIKALSEGNADYMRNKAAERAEKGRTHKSAEPKERPASDPSDEKEYDRMLKKAREVVTTVADNIDILVYGVGAETVDETFEIADVDPELQILIATKFGTDYTIIKFLFQEGIINKDLVELLWETI